MVSSSEISQCKLALNLKTVEYELNKHVRFFHIHLQCFHRCVAILLIVLSLLCIFVHLYVRNTKKFACIDRLSLSPSMVRISTAGCLLCPQSIANDYCR